MTYRRLHESLQALESKCTLWLSATGWAQHTAQVTVNVREVDRSLYRHVGPFRGY